MKQYVKNPRQITEKQFSQLGVSLHDLGDLSGVVHDLNSDQIIGGNQRSRVFDVNKCKIEMVQTFDQPDEQGTVGLGFIVWQGKKYSYRQVRWDEKTCQRANITANKAGGNWDFDVMANNFETSDLLNWGFDERELQLGGFDLDGDKPDDPGAQIDKAEELREKWGVKLGNMYGLGKFTVCPKCGKVHDL